MTDWLFDGPNRIITEPLGTGDTSFDVERDLYSAWKRWVASGVGSNFLEAFVVEGGTPIGTTGIFTGTTYVLVNGWKIQAAAYSHQVTLNGNLYSSDGIVSVPPSSSSATIFINSSVAAQGISTGSGVTSQDVTDIKNAIFQEIIEGTESFAEQIRLIRAEAAGDLNISGNTVSIRDAVNSKSRIVANTTTLGERSITLTDGT